jgi:streptogramin lyase
MTPGRCHSMRRVQAVLVAALMTVPFAGVVTSFTARAAGATPVFTYFTDSSISSPWDITAGPDGAVWFTNRQSNTIGRVSTAGTVTSYTGTGITFPLGITAGPDGALWFTNQSGGGSNHGSIGRITTAGTVTNYTDPSIYFPYDIAAGSDGALWFTNAVNNSIGRITTAGMVSNYTGAGVASPHGITAGPDGALWFTNQSGGQSIGRITTAGTITSYTGPGLNFPYNIAAGSDGALWFTNHGSASIGRVTTAGTVTNYTGAGISYPDAISGAPDGSLWFTNDGSLGITRITTAGALTPYADPGINTNFGITAGPDGSMWFTNVNSIGRITPTAPGAPTVGIATTGTGSLTVPFTGPADDGGSLITDFTASCVSSDGGVFGTESGTASPVVVSGVSNGNTYSCTVTATNGVGTSAPSAASNAVVVGAPGAPLDLSVVPASGSATLSWTAPPENAAPIDHYDGACQSSDGGALGQATVPASPVTITGLTAGNTYTCSVTATNASGTGLAATSPAFVDGDLPDAPTSVTVNRGDTSATVSFAEGASNGYTILDFTASCASIPVWSRSAPGSERVLRRLLPTRSLPRRCPPRRQSEPRRPASARRL